MKAKVTILAALAVVLVVPFLLQREGESLIDPDGRVIVITPHNEAIRYEFGQGFRRWYEERTGKRVVVDWRVIGGTSEIVRKVESDYLNAFRNYWENDLGRDWSIEVQESFMNRRIKPDDTPGDDTLAEAARRAFLASDISCGIDIFFGGGSYDFDRQARAGTLVSDGLLERKPGWFDADSLPQTYAGEPYWDPEGRWYGAVLSTFGIIFNRDALDRVGFTGIPDSWRDLADPRFFGEVALADPTKSGSITKAFEMIIQKEMQDIYAFHIEDGLSEEAAGARAVREGWDAGMRLILQIAANARYFTDSSTKPSLDVSAGDCAIGMSIDFYGRQQAEFNNLRGGSDRFGYVAPEAATTVSVDPIALFRGAPNPGLGRAFIEYVMSPEGQKLWNFKVGTPGGPRLYALRRSPARRELYDPALQQYRSDPDVNDYETAGDFVYRGSWTGPLFSPLRYIIRVACLDVHDELKAAWAEVIRARREGRITDAVAAEDVLTDVSRVDYAAASGPIHATLRSRDKIEEVRLSKELAAHFRAQYARAAAIARGEAEPER